MLALPAHLLRDCHEQLCRCEQFSSLARLKTVFNVPELAAYRDALRDADNTRALVERTTDYLLAQDSFAGKFVIVTFLQMLVNNHVPHHTDLHTQLTRITQQIDVYLHPPATPPEGDLRADPGPARPLLSPVTDHLPGKPELLQRFQNWTVRIHVARFAQSGTGFFIQQDHVLTCAHVLVRADSEEMPLVHIYWHGADFEARVVALSPTTYPDLALLKLLSASPISHSCAECQAEVHLTDRLYTYGYTQEYPAGDPSLFTYEGQTGAPDSLLKFQGGEVRAGLSGAPLLNLQTGSVCGVVKRTRGEDTLIGGRAVPIAQVQDLLLQAGLQKLNL